MAAALGVLRRSDEGQSLSGAVLLAAHDLLYEQVPFPLGESSLCRLAELLVGRGVVPKSSDYEGRWYLWWPKSGRGPCRDCGKSRSLTRFSGRFGDDYRYLCARCRATERHVIAERVEQLHAMPGVQAAHSAWVCGPGPTGTRSAGGTEAEIPSAQEWSEYATRLHEMLSPLEWAGFELPEEWDTDFDRRHGGLLFETLWRGDGGVGVSYHPHEGKVVLGPFDDVAGQWPHSYSLLEDSLEIPVPGSGRQAAAAVEVAAGQAGLLDATHVYVAESAPEEARQEFTTHRIRRIFQPAAEFRRLPLNELLRETTEDHWLSSYLDWVVGRAGQDVAPDIVPDAAALGVAAWCWRNNTAVEAHHLETDVLMARVNIAVTRLTRQYICPVEGIDWDSIKDALMDPGWALPDTTPIHSLFGEGWTEVAATVCAELDRWRRLDHERLGAQTTLILMTIGGSTGYTDSWWGQGRWHSICRHILDEAIAAGLTLPAPYDRNGPEAFLADLHTPDRLSDAALDWIIDLRGAAFEGPRGLRMNRITRPPRHCWDPFWHSSTGV
ncbi:hypothetical protein ABZY68_16295 [Streptomyces sp. NPDC006482]|uniref:hypothetical protein n=1 Tax=Streptomyces sp. NPDC006482 TaxID=3154306 RepID=UPI0033ADD4FB